VGQHLLLAIHFHDRRYHGTGEWPPAPGRVFQALVAGAALGNTLPPEVAPALEWLEGLPPPVIAAPRSHQGARVDLFVPNNDIDSVGGNPANVDKIRTKKTVQPQLLETAAPLLYAWPIPNESPLAAIVIELAEGLYQLGRGVDMAWAVGEIASDETLTSLLMQHDGTVHRPGGGAGETALACPAPGTLNSLLKRHAANASKLRTEGEGRNAVILFAQPPKPSFASVGYDAPVQRRVYELRDLEDPGKLWPWPVAKTVALTERLRDAAADRLRAGASEADNAAIERTLIGRKPGAKDTDPLSARVRIVPLPSIGSEYADHAVRRVLVEIPSACSLSRTDVEWAFSGLVFADPQTGEVVPFVVAVTSDEKMLGHYSKEARCWRSVTPLALPDGAARRRIEPTRRNEEPKNGTERASEDAKASAAVQTALRHALHGSQVRATEVRVQREPFQARGTRAEAFAHGSRFPKERLWHVQVTLTEPVRGPLLLGDGRFLGLGLMAPISQSAGMFGFEVDGAGPERSKAIVLARALRKAVMSRVQAVLGRRQLGRFFSGHEENGAPARSDQSSHLAFHWDPAYRRLLIIAPHLLDHRNATREELEALRHLEQAITGFADLRAGNAGRYQLRLCEIDDTDWYLGHATSWVSASPYTVTRHRKGLSVAAAIADDAVAECARRGFPKPSVRVTGVNAVPGRGLEGRIVLEFATPVAGPVALGRTRYLGGGLFARAEQSISGGAT
jgi:CRISPR-associated protein Csb2